MTRTHVDVPSGRLLVVDEGSGPPIVLLHAGIADLRSWDAMVPFLTGAGYRAVRFDQRGVGGSTTEPVEFSRATDLLAVLDATAIVAPERVVAIVWVDGPGQPPTRVPAAIRNLVHEMDLVHPDRHQGEAKRLEPPANDRLAELRCPILAVAGELDVSDVVQTARHLEADAPNARAIVWPDVAHMIGMEQPERLASAIVEFLAPLERWS